MVLYLIAAYAIRWLRTGRLTDNENRFLLTHVFDSATFSGSAILLYGIWSPEVLALLGSTKPFLLVGGLAGLIYSFHALGPRT